MAKKFFIPALTKRYQCIIRNEENLTESVFFHFTYIRCIAICGIICLLFLALSLFLTHTCLSKWCNPLHVERENQAKMGQLAADLAALEQQTHQQTKFISLLQQHIANEQDPTYPVSPSTSLPEELPTDPATLDSLIAAESSLRQEFTDQDASHAGFPRLHNGVKELTFFSPITGIITHPFNPGDGHYGVDLVAKEGAPIRCIADGIVILASWTVETGWIIAIQHANDLISIYKHCAKLSKKVSSFVKVGDTIAMMGNSGELSTGPHLHFEIWYDGQAMNPESVILF